MSRCTRAGHRRIQPYAWLGAGAVTLGMGAAMVGGTAVAFADTGADSGPGASAGTSTSAPSNPTKNDVHARRGAASRAAASAGDAAPAASTPVRRIGAAASANATPDVAASAAAVQASSNKPAPAAATTPAVRRSAQSAAAAVAAQAASTASVSTATAPAASVSSAAADPAPGTDTWLPGAGSNPGQQIVPGTHFAMALTEIKATQTLLTQETWGAGNILAGIGSLGPQALLATAQLSLMIWAGTIGGVQDFVSKTAGIPLVKYLGRAAVFNELLIPMVSDISLGVAVKLIPTLGWVGADVTTAESTVTQAQQNGKVYAVVPLRVKSGTEPTVKAKLNGGSNATLLVDTGASGVVTTRDKIGSAALGPITGGGNSCFSGGICYHYDTYNMTVDLGNGATTTAPVNIVTDNADYPDSVKNFKSFFAWGADGILGVGANTEGPGPAPIPTAAMPGELSDGVLVFQNLLPLGLGGVMILGPNPLPTRVSVPGAPNAYVKVSVNGGAKQDAGTIIDSGGVYGTLNDYLFSGTPTGQGNLPAGTKIDVYTADGSTLLYSYTAKGDSSPTPVIDTGLFNTGNAPFKQNPIYLNYGFNNPYGIGSTDFSIW